MKIRIKTYNGELPSYLTAGRVYEVIDGMDNVSVIRDNHSDIQIVMIFNCPHLNGGSWEVVSD